MYFRPETQMLGGCTLAPVYQTKVLHTGSRAKVSKHFDFVHSRQLEM